MSTVTADYLGRMLDPVVACLTAESAQRLVELRPDPDVQAHIAELAEKANEGTISPEERADYREYVEAMDLIGILQAKASAFVARSSSH